MTLAIADAAELERAILAIRVVDHQDGHDLIRRESVIEILDARAQEPPPPAPRQDPLSLEERLLLRKARDTGGLHWTELEKLLDALERVTRKP
jgi:hypothetical protein